MTYSEHLNIVLNQSKKLAIKLGSPSITPDHLLLGMISTESGKAYSLLKSTGVDLEKTRRALESRNFHSGSDVTSPTYDKQSERILRILELEARSYHVDTPHTEHLLLALLRERVNKAATYLSEQYNLTYEVLEKQEPKPKPQQTPKAAADFSSDLEDDTQANDAPHEETEKKKSNSATPCLDKYGKDLTRQAEDGVLDPVIGREKEIERVIEILSRRKKNNPILIGDPGVGKSAIVEGLALRIVKHEVSPLLFDKRIITLDIASMVAGTTYRGQFEERMKSVITELQKNKNIILFIDEIHTLIGAGNASGTLDAANILKPALARGEVQCVGATTISEYRRTVEKDGALERRFQKVMVVPTSKEETLDILRRLSVPYGKHHNVCYTEAVLKACVELTDRYVSDRAFPDKAIDAMDEVGARAQVETKEKPAFISEYDNDIATLENQQHNAEDSGDLKQALALREKQSELRTRLNSDLKQWKSERLKQPIVLTEDDVAHVVSLMSGVPVQRVQTAENERLRNMASILKQRVIGQDEAVDAVVKAIQRSRLGLKDPNRPIGAFFFLGPTGVGKTHLAQTLAEEMFGQKDALIRFDMSEYMEKHTTSLLVGAPPGYVAHEDGGKLTEAVRRKPYSIVLFDEIEKAHPDIFNVLLQVLDEGRLTDRQGRVVDFKNTIIILTSNVGTRQLKDFGSGIGFRPNDDIDNKAAKAILLKALQKQFPPEFVNRIDSIVTFATLEKDSLYKIFDIELSELKERLATQGFSLNVTDAVKDKLIEQSDSKQYGARPLRRAIQNTIEDALTSLLLLDERHEHIDIVLKDDKPTAQWA
ncbi:MAG: ATP-dependent Clp protease ATP-binding subunit [Paludibacteraceae bacterium]|nr:ATP-dependent Clp protease ATP-binding subunit [Paludibacteraceae bacterium]